MPPWFGPDHEGLALARDLLASARRILVTTHLRPDGDAVGSLLAVGRALRAVGKEVTTHTPSPPPTFLRFLPDVETITNNPGSLPSTDLVIALDHTNLSRTGLAGDLLEYRRPLITIDHHHTADHQATVRFVIPEAAATCELLAELLPLLALPVDAATATCLLTGLVTDTGSFQHPNTTSRVLALASALLEAGADLSVIVTGVFERRPVAALRLLGRALERLQRNLETGAVISVITHEDLRELGAGADDLTGIANLLNTIPETRFALLLTEVERGRLQGSLRSAPPTSGRDRSAENAVDVSAIAQRFGGGGHRLASGFEIAGRLVRDNESWRIE